MQRKPAEYLPFVYLPLLLLVTAAYAWQPLIGNDDFWAHAAVGRWIAANHRIPDHTLFLWTANEPWIPHPWLTQLFFYNLMRAGGETGGPYLALFLTVLLSACPWALVWTYYRRHFGPQALIIPLFLMAIWVSSSRYDPRPELFTASFIALLYVYLSVLHERDRVHIPSTVGLLCMFALWANLHGAVAYGLVLIWITAALDTGQSLLQHRNSPSSRWWRFEWGLAALATVVVFTCNPQGVSLYKALLPIQSAVFARIDEWKPLWAWPAVNSGAIVVELVLLGGAIVLWSRNKDRRWHQLAWLLVMAFFLVKARRNLWLMAITSMFVIAGNAALLNSDRIFANWRALSRRFDPTGTEENNAIPEGMRLLVRCSLVLLLAMSVAFAIPADEPVLRATSPKLPQKLAQFVYAKTKGRLFNDYENSAYLEWHFKGRRELYIDLINAYPDSLMLEYFDITGMSKGYMEILDRRGTQVIALRPPMLEKESLPLFVKKLEVDKRWKRVYRGKDGTVFIRRGGVNKL